jgi:hypothetical protein
MALKLKMRGDVVSDLASRAPSTLTPSPVDTQMGAPAESSPPFSPGASRFKPVVAAAPSSTSERARNEINARAAERQIEESRARRKKVFRMLFFIVVLLAVAGGAMWYFGWVQWREGRLVFSPPGEGARDAAVENSAEPTTLFGKMGQFLRQNLQQTGNDISASVKESAPASKFDGVMGKIESAASGVKAAIVESVRPEEKGGYAAAASPAAKARMQGSALRLEGLFVDKNGARLARINGQMLKSGAEIAGLKIVLITDKDITVSDGTGTRRVKMGGWLQ